MNTREADLTAIADGDLAVERVTYTVTAVPQDIWSSDRKAAMVS